MQARTAPKPKYNYLETEAALPFPVPKVKVTEKQCNSTGGFMDESWSLNQRKWNNNETKPRARSGRSTHFIFGSDEPVFSTEQRLKFDGQLRQDQDIVAAGKTENIPSMSFDHVKISNNTDDVKPEPQVTSKMESLQARLNNMTRSLPSLPVHHASLMQNDYMDPKQKQ